MKLNRITMANKKTNAETFNDLSKIPIVKYPFNKYLTCKLIFLNPVQKNEIEKLLSLNESIGPCSITIKIF